MEERAFAISPSLAALIDRFLFFEIVDHRTCMSRNRCRFFKWNPLDGNGKLGADLLVKYGGKIVTIEIKNWDFSVADAARARKAAARFSEQLVKRHLPALEQAEEGKRALIVIIGSDVPQDAVNTSATSMRSEIVRKAKSLGPDNTAKFTVDNVLFLNQRTSVYSSETIKQVLRIAPNSTVTEGVGSSVGELLKRGLDLASG